MENQGSGQAAMSMKIAQTWNRVVERVLPRESAELVWEDPPPPSGETEATLLKLAAIEPRQASELRLLDFGCGEGRYLRMFEKTLRKDNLYGCDVVPASVDKARADGFSVELLSEHHAEIPHPWAFFDRVFSSNVIEHIPRPQYLTYLREIHRVLKPGGIFVIGAPNYPIKRAFDLGKALRDRRFRRYYLFDDPTHCNKLSIVQVERDLAQWFEEIHLMPSRLPLQALFGGLRDPQLRYRLRRLGEKFTGSCRKPLASQ